VIVVSKLLFDCLLDGLSPGRQVEQLYIGHNWTLSIIRDGAGRQKAGLASTPSAREVAAQTSLQPGSQPPPVLDAMEVAALVRSINPVEAAVGLATLNALLEPDPALIKEIDAADWLAEHGYGRKVALVGRFPFVEALRPIVSRLWVLELAPQPGEYGPDQAATIIPQAEIVGITSSALINHTLDGLLRLVQPEARVILIGPSTPLTPRLFDFGIDLLFGVEVVDIEAALSSIVQGVSFRHKQGVQRVTLQKGLS
jgi:uncharacterized protein (DUF4213/DUF364 family)